MKRTTILICILLMFALMIYTNIDHIIWLKGYAKTGFDWTEEIVPLLWNNIVWLCLIPLFIIWNKEKEIPNWLLWLTVATTVVQIATTINSKLADDALAAGMPFVVLTIPISIILFVFSIKHLRTCKVNLQY